MSRSHRIVTASTRLAHAPRFGAPLALGAAGLLGLLAVGAAGGGLTGCHTSEASEHGAAAPKGGPGPGEVWLTAQQVADGKVTVSDVADQDVDDVVLASGKVAFDDQRVAHVFSPVSGRVTRIDALLGGHVTKGAPLLAIESPDIGIASSDLGKARADLLAAEHDYTRQTDLAGNHAASQKDVESSEDNFRKAKAEMERAKQKAYLFHAGGGGGGGGDVSQGYTLVSPMDGEVTMKNVTPGIEIQGQYSSGQAVELFTIGQIDKVWVVADVFEVDIARVKVGAKAVVQVVAYPGKAREGTVDWISGMLDPQTRTAKVRCSFDNADHLLKPEMYATVQVAAEERQALAIPRAALVRLGDQTLVFVQSGAAPDGRVKFERLPVTVDDVEGSSWVPVSHGLDKGAKVVTSGAQMLTGML